MTNHSIACLVGFCLFAAPLAAQTSLAPLAPLPTVGGVKIGLAAEELAAEAKVLARLTTDATFLSSDALQGRGIRTPGIDLAADYIAAQFKLAGLRTELYDGTPFQKFSYGIETVLDRQHLEFPGAAQLADGDFQAIRRSQTGPFELPVAFAGFGIQAPASNYDDYAGFDPAGKALIVLRHEPRWGRDDSRLPRDRGEGRPSTHALIATKVDLAMKLGAKAILFCNDGQTKTEQADQELLKFNSRSGTADQIPVFHCRRQIVSKLLQDSTGKSLDELERQINDSWQAASADLPRIVVKGELAIQRRGRQLKNVIGVLDGVGPNKEETVVIGAHYDHLGMGGAGSLAGWTVQIHNGADDNASGTAAMLEVARQIAGRGPLRRRVVFIGFSAEESGLIGSDRYVRSPLIPIKDTVAMLNLDMVGRLRESMEVHGTKTAKEFDSLLSQFAPKYLLRIQRHGDGYGPSDHASFFEHGVPVLHFFTGLHKDYHRPSDDADKLNMEGMRRITLLTTDIAMAIVQADKAPQRGSGMGDLLELSGIDSTPRRGTKLGVRVRDVEGKPQFIQVLERTPAHQAGMRSGDVIVSANGQDIRDSRQFLDLVRGSAAGSKLTVVIRRGSAELEMQVELGGGENQ
ncbi:MAG: M28 family peptidase [Planctomycetales bacterium]|nr:M28 family peptidase [Planctomycetales bacterium]